MKNLSLVPFGCQALGVFMVDRRNQLGFPRCRLDP